MDTSKATANIKTSIRNLLKLTNEQKLCVPYLSSVEKDNIIFLYNDIFGLLVDTIEDICRRETNG